MTAASNIGPTRILYLHPFPPHPYGLHGGARSLGRLLEAIPDDYSAGVIYLRAADEPPIHFELARHLHPCVEVARRLARTEGLGRWVDRSRLMGGLLAASPIWVTHWRVADFAAAVRKVVAEWRPDVVQMDFHLMAQYRAAVADLTIPCVLVQHEPGSLAASEHLAATSDIFSRSLAGLDLRAWRRYERKAMDAMDAVVVFTQRDADHLARYTRTPITVIPLATEIDDALDPAGEPDRLVFIGNFMHPPNVDAALRLATSIFPAIRGHRPTARLDLVGDQPSSELRSHAGDGVRVTGRVPDVTEYLDRAAVVIIPLRRGGGMRVKVMEALAAGKAIVASPLAVDGLNVQDGVHLVLAETDEEFSARAVELLEDEPRRRALAAAAREWATRELAPERTWRGFDRLYRTLWSKGRANAISSQA